MSQLNIYQRLINAQTELKAPKGQYNDYGGFNYRSAEDILEAVKPINKKHGLVLFISDELVTAGATSERHYIQANVTLVNLDKPSETIEITAMAREATSKKGMDESQITGTASSYARKYALNGLYLIDDTKDSDTNEYQQQQNRPQQQQPPQSNQGQQITPPSKSEAVQKAKELRISISNLKQVSLETVDGWLFSHFGVTDSSQLTDWNEVVLYLIRLESKAKEQLAEEQARQQQLSQQVQSGLNWEDANG